MPRAKSAQSAGKPLVKATKKSATKKSATKSIRKKAAKSSSKPPLKAVGTAASTKASTNAAATLNVVTNGMRTPPPPRKLKYSKPFDPSHPNNPPKFNINFVSVTAISGGAVPDPGALSNLTIEHGSSTAHVLHYAYTDRAKKTLIIWFFVWTQGRIKHVSLADLVVTIDSSSTQHEGTDPQVETVDP